MPTIFISYRQDDSAAEARQLNDRLCQSFGEENIFFDISSIALGDDFIRVIEEKVASSDMLIAVIGPHWTAIKKKGQPRLNDPMDPVRIEIVTALERGIRVVPVLVGGASMPASEELPDNLRKLAYRNGHELSHTRFKYDVEQLIKKLGGTITPEKSKAAAVETVLESLAKGLAGRMGAGSQETSLPPPAPFNVTGTWRALNGLLQNMWQQGNQLTVQGLNQFGVVCMQGRGTIVGSQLHVIYDVVYQPPYTVRGEARGEVSPDGLVIRGTAMDPASGPVPFELHRIS